MTDPYTIAFLVVPLVLAALGWVYELLAERAESRHSNAAE
jgi:cytochrome bd-type quinol oxidase subunit 2